MLSRLPIVLSLVVFACTASVAQTSSGELRIRVVDPQGLAVDAGVTILSESTQTREALSTGRSGLLDVQHLAWGDYLVRVEHPGFAPASKIINLHSAVPMRTEIVLQPAGTSTTVHVSAAQTLLDRDAAGSVSLIGKQQIRDRAAALPGRGLIELVNSEPGWLEEGNAVLHPRGSEYQTQFVVDGIPLTENRSPGFGSQIEASDIQSIAVYTAGIPAEFGRKMGGVVELNTLRTIQPGLHGEVSAYGGSFASRSAYASLDDGWGRNSLGVTASGAGTDWYENPPVLQNYTNNGTTGDFSGHYERQFSDRDRLTTSLRHEFAHFLVPNEQIQQAAGQRQARSTSETMGMAAWQHILSSATVSELSGMVRDDTVLLSSNALSTPILAGQDRGFFEGYLKGTITHDWHHQEAKAGFEGDFLHLHEAFNYTITDPTQFDPGTPPVFAFAQSAPDREGALFVEDTIHAGNWTLAPGLRWDEYSLLVQRSAFSPRVAVSRYFPNARLVAHVAWDHVFQTPAVENILLSSSPRVVSLDTQVLRKPVLPSVGNYYEAGVTKSIQDQLRLAVNVYLRRESNFADDNPLLDTSISFPISFDRASIFGAEGRIDLPSWRALSGDASYSYMLGTCYLPVTGGLFLGDQATQALNQLSGRLWVSQDQRHTARTRWTLHLPHGFQAASGMSWNSGLPVDFDGTRDQALAQYGSTLVDRVNFERGRVDPSLSVDVSAGREWAAGDHVNLRLQADGENLTNRVDLIDFAGLFSGNAVAPGRSGAVTLTVRFQ